MVMVSLSRVETWGF